MMKCEGCGMLGGSFPQIHVTNGVLTLCDVCLYDVNRKNPHLIELRKKANIFATFFSVMAERMEQWATDSQQHGWSTHQVEANRKTATQMRVEAAKLLAAIAASEPSLLVTRSTS